jgi:hypothetical protein
MWSELPKFFGRSFAIGYFLPSTAILLVFSWIFFIFGYGDEVRQFMSKNNEWVGVALSIFILWIGGIILMALNREIIRFFEGYGEGWNPLRVLVGRKRRSFAGLSSEIDKLRQERKAASNWPSERLALYGKKLREYAENYPDNIDNVLPTCFGNQIRAFEVYPRVIYGLDAIPGWSRLLAVIPADYRQTIDDSKAQVDFWVNVLLGSWLTLFLYGALAFVHRVAPQPWLPAVALIVAWFGSYGARQAAGEWGSLVMSAFDLFRADLCKKLGLKMPASIHEEREMWVLMSRVMIYRSKEASDRLSRFRDTGSDVPPGWADHSDQ